MDNSSTCRIRGIGAEHCTRDTTGAAEKERESGPVVQMIGSGAVDTPEQYHKAILSATNKESAHAQ